MVSVRILMYKTFSLPMIFVPAALVTFIRHDFTIHTRWQANTIKLKNVFRGPQVKSEDKEDSTDQLPSVAFILTKQNLLRRDRRLWVSLNYGKNRRTRATD